MSRVLIAGVVLLALLQMQGDQVEETTTNPTDALIAAARDATKRAETRAKPTGDLVAAARAATSGLEAKTQPRSQDAVAAALAATAEASNALSSTGQGEANLMESQGETVDELVQRAMDATTNTVRHSKLGAVEAAQRATVTMLGDVKNLD